jgi:hypothetical protein
MDFRFQSMNLHISVLRGTTRTLKCPHPACVAEAFSNRRTGTLRGGEGPALSHPHGRIVASVFVNATVSFQ